MCTCKDAIVYLYRIFPVLLYYERLPIFATHALCGRIQSTDDVRKTIPLCKFSTGDYERPLLFRGRRFWRSTVFERRVSGRVCSGPRFLCISCAVSDIKGRVTHGAKVVTPRVTIPHGKSSMIEWRHRTTENRIHVCPCSLIISN